MARAYGSSAHLLMKRETTYGQAATGNYIRMPFNRCNLGSEQGLIDDPVLGQGRDPLAPLQDVITDEGDIVLPVDPRFLGLWLTGLFGDPDTTDNLDGSWDHEFASGGDDLPSYTLEVGMPKVPSFFRHAGVKLNSIALEFTRSGPAAATINAIAQRETRFGTSQGGTPTSLTFSRISQFHVWTAPALQEPLSILDGPRSVAAMYSALSCGRTAAGPDGIRGSTSNQGLRASSRGELDGFGSIPVSTGEPSHARCPRKLEKPRHPRGHREGREDVRPTQHAPWLRIRLGRSRPGSSAPTRSVRFCWRGRRWRR
jgi:Phage tail tube protein